MRSLAMVVLTLAAMATCVHGACSTVNDLSLFQSCMPALIGTMPALPTTECCNTIKQADLTCLRTAVSTSTIPDLNQEAAIMLPKKCGIVPIGLSTCRKHGIQSAWKLVDLH